MTPRADLLAGALPRRSNMNARPRPRRRLALGLLALLLCAGSAARADIVVMRDGRRIEGEIVREDASEVEVKMRVGRVTLQRADVVDIIRQKTPDQLYEEQLAAAETADDHFALGEWCVEQRMRRRSERAYERAVELDPMHAGANLALGNVLHEDEWMTPEERDRRIELAREEEMRARGLVRHGERWVTEEERQQLERGLVLHEGEWMTQEAAYHAQGLIEFEGAWVRAAVGRAHQRVDRVQALLGRELGRAGGDEWLVAGPLQEPSLVAIDAGMQLGRAAYHEHWDLEPESSVIGDELALFYVTGSDSSSYLTPIPHLAGLSETLPEGWAEAVRTSHGFIYYDPVPTSSARQWNRSELDLQGHNYHHLGHVLVNRTGYDGKLLPPWYEESMAALVEYWSHGKNRVFCRARSLTRGGESISGRPIATGNFDPRGVRTGEWVPSLQRALGVHAVSSFDRLSRLDFSELELVDIATGMAILSWIDAAGEEGALQRFHAALKSVAPSSPGRLLERGRPSFDRWENAFQSSVGMGMRQADQEWRAWILNR